MKSNSFKRGICLPLYRRLKSSQTRLFHLKEPPKDFPPLENFIKVNSGIVNRPQTCKHRNKKEFKAVDAPKEEEFSLLPLMMFDDTEKKPTEIPSSPIQPRFSCSFKMNKGFPIRLTRICRGLPRKSCKIL